VAEVRNRRVSFLSYIAQSKVSTSANARCRFGNPYIDSPT